MTVVSIQLYPETNAVHLFAGENTIPTQTMVIKGAVELRLTRPVRVRQIMVCFKGAVHNFIGNDLVPFNESKNDDVRLWPTTLRHSRHLPLVDRVAQRVVHSALGFTDVKQTILRKEILLLPEQATDPGSPPPTRSSGTSLQAGTFRFPFEIHIGSAHEMPPSILLCRHMIRYELSAQLQLASLKEFVKLKYWHARTYSWHSARRHFSLPFFTSSSRRHRSNSAASSISSLSSSTSSSEASCTIPSEPTPALSSSAPAISENDATIPHLEQPPRMLRVSKVIRVYRHNFANMDLVAQIPRIRYTGCRASQLRYQISLPKFACLQLRSISGVCRFNPLSDKGRVASVEVYLEQKEKYPLHVGEFNGIAPVVSKDTMTEHVTKLASTNYVVMPEEQETPLEIIIPFQSNHIAQDVNTSSLQISHRVRVIVSFMDKTNRRMHLSFPIQIGTVPLAIPQHTWHEEDFWVPDESQDIDDTSYPWDIETESMMRELPSYNDVLQEGPPPVVFMEDNLAYYQTQQV